VRYAYCVTPDHRQGILLAQRYSGSQPVGDPERVDRSELPVQWRPAALDPQRSPVERARASPRAAAMGPVTSFVVGMFVSNVLIWLADRIGGTTTVGATVVDKGFHPGSRGNDFSIRLRSDAGEPVHIDDGDVRAVWQDVAVGDHVQVLASGFTGRTVGVETADSALYLAGGWGEPVAWLLLCLAVVWLIGKALTWPRLRWSLVRVAPVGVVAGVLLSVLGGS
jgi:hypothetical protein